MELMEVYHEAMATWIIARVTSGKCEGAAFVFASSNRPSEKKRQKFFSHQFKN
jgi:hypothetical protein